MRILLLFIIISVNLGHSQTTWCPAGAQWTYAFSSQSNEGYQILNYKNDTIIQSQACKKIERTAVWRNNNWIQYPPPPDTSFMEPIYTFERNDTVFVYYEQMFRPVYFFNAQIGDTLTLNNFSVFSLFWEGHGGCTDLLRYKVDTIGTKIIHGDTLRYYKASCIDSQAFVYGKSFQVVEKLGMIDNYMVPYFYCATDGEEAGFTCYQDDQFPNYNILPPPYKCHIDFVSRDEKLSLQQTSIYPNPFQTKIHLENIPAQSTWQILDLSGKLLTSGQTVIPDDFIEPELPPGMYFLHFPEYFLSFKIVQE